MNLLTGTLAIGLLLSLLTLGVFISYRVLDRVDLTTDGAFGIGAAVAAALVVRDLSPAAATLAAAAAGAAAGLATGLVHTALRVHILVAGILTTTALYSVALFVMGGGDVAVAPHATLFTIAESWWGAAGFDADGVTILGTRVSAGTLAALLPLTLVAGGATVLLAWLFRTRAGLALRAAGDNARMASAQGVHVSAAVVAALAIANALTALAGGLLAQYDGFANIQMGIGMIVTGLACLLLGEAVIGRGRVRRTLVAAIVGTIVFRLLVAAAIRAGLPANALKLATALFLLAALVLPGAIARRGGRGAVAAPSRG